MTQNARLEKTGLVVKRRRSRRPAKTGLRVALQAEQVDVAQPEHVGIRTTVHQVAGLAAVYFYRLVFKHEGTLLVGVALEADRILRRRRAHLLGFHCTVWIVAVGALYEPFIDPMVGRHVQLCFLLQMTREAKLGLGLYEQKIRVFTVVRRVPGDATDAVLRMLRVD